MPQPYKQKFELFDKSEFEIPLYFVLIPCSKYVGWNIKMKEVIDMDDCLYKAKTKQNFTMYKEAFDVLFKAREARVILNFLFICLPIAFFSRLLFGDLEAVIVLIISVIMLLLINFFPHIYAWFAVRKQKKKTNGVIKHMCFSFFSDYMEICSESGDQVHKLAYADILDIKETKHYYCFLFPSDKNKAGMYVILEKAGFEKGDAKQVYELVRPKGAHTLPVKEKLSKPKKSRSILVIVVTILVIVLSLVWLGFSAAKFFSGNFNEVNNRMFEQIEELEKLEPYVMKELSVDDDRYARKLEIEESYLCKVEYNDCTYKVYAYIFKDDANAKKYFRNITGNELDLDASFSSSSNWFTYTDYVAYRNNFALFVSGKDYDSCVEFINWLNADFSKSLYE